jgi:addiction module HigA family antidote
MLDATPDLRTLSTLPGNRLERFKGDRKGQYSTRINNQWRICFVYGTRKRKPVHLGEILREEFMIPLGLSMNMMAMALRVPVTRIADLVNERWGITADTALRFGRYFENSAAFWLNLQTRYDLEVAEDKIARKVETRRAASGGSSRLA